MGDGDVRTPERRDDLDSDSLEFESFDHDNHLEPLQLRLTDDVNLGFVVRSERRDTQRHHRMEMAVRGKRGDEDAYWIN